MRCIWFILPSVVSLLPTLAVAACNIVDGKAYGDCRNVTVTHGAKPALNLRSTIAESAIVSGATVHPGGALYLSGISNGDIVVRRGGQLTVTGVVNGTVRNEGGSVSIEGMVKHLASNGGVAMIEGSVGSFSGVGPAVFMKGSVLAGTPLPAATRMPTQ